MKLLMLGWELPPHNSGGLGVACYQLCKALSVQGVCIDFVLPYQETHDIDFMNVISAQSDEVVEMVRVGSAYDSYLYTFIDGHEEWLDIYSQQKMYERGVKKLTKNMQFDVIHAHDWLTFEAALAVKQTTGRPMILHVHSLEHDRAGGKQGNPLVHDIEARAFAAADTIIAVSKQTKNAIVDMYNIDESKIDVIHNSVDMQDVQHLDYRNSFVYIQHMKKMGYKIVLSLGRLTVQKGLFNLLHAAREVIQINPKTIFLIVGGGEQYTELVELAASLGISKNVIFTGFLRGKSSRDAFAVADLFVMPSVSEPFGLTPLEAAGYGVPSVVSKQSGVSEVLKNCFKVDYWDVKKMADGIIAVTSQPSLRSELRKNAFREYVRLSWNESASRVAKQYQHQSRGVNL